MIVPSEWQSLLSKKAKDQSKGSKLIVSMSRKRVWGDLCRREGGWQFYGTFVVARGWTGTTGQGSVVVGREKLKPYLFY